MWEDLNANYSSYGSIPISIDYANPDLCGDTFTLAALEASGADVVILSDPAGGLINYTRDEVAALKQYAAEGHNVIGTYLTFAYPDGPIDNSALARLFGLKADDGWTGGDRNVNPTYTWRRAGALARNLPNSYASNGYPYSQRPGDRVWSRHDLKGAKIVGINPNGDAAITLYNGAAYNAIYIANMPESGGTEDEQFLYNAIIYPAKR
jgi:hypothetical protein